MRQITIISGKGGTGKTTLTASFVELSKNIVVADCDVDAPDLHILLRPEIVETADFNYGEKYFIDVYKCNLCKKCYEVCSYDAIKTGHNDNLYIDEYICENCGLCNYVCPQKAIHCKTEKSGEWYIANYKYGKMVYANLYPGEENSGKLVSLVRNKTMEIASRENNELIIIDGPPGKGCPVIASITGVDAVVVVTEPTVSGILDSKSVIDLTNHFNIMCFVVINKASINYSKSDEIINYCKKNNIDYAGSIDYDKCIMDAVSKCEPVVNIYDNKITNQIKSIWGYIKRRNFL